MKKNYLLFAILFICAQSHAQKMLNGNLDSAPWVVKTLIKVTNPSTMEITIVEGAGVILDERWVLATCHIPLSAYEINIMENIEYEGYVYAGKEKFIVRPNDLITSNFRTKSYTYPIRRIYAFPGYVFDPNNGLAQTNGVMLLKLMKPLKLRETIDYIPYIKEDPFENLDLESEYLIAISGFLGGEAQNLNPYECNFSSLNLKAQYFDTFLDPESSNEYELQDDFDAALIGGDVSEYPNFSQEALAFSFIYDLDPGWAQGGFLGAPITVEVDGTPAVFGLNRIFNMPTVDDGTIKLRRKGRLYESDYLGNGLLINNYADWILRITGIPGVTRKMLEAKSPPSSEGSGNSVIVNAAEIVGGIAAATMLYKYIKSRWFRGNVIPGDGVNVNLSRVNVRGKGSNVGKAGNVGGRRRPARKVKPRNRGC